MKRWHAHYKDEFHDEDIIIVKEEADKYDNLSFTIDGITFQLGRFNNFELRDPAQAELAQERFRLLKRGGKMSLFDHTVPYGYTLQRYTLVVEIPLQVIRTADGTQIEGILHVGFRYVPHDMTKVQSRIYCDDRRVWLDDQEGTEFRLTVDGEEYSVPCKDLWFEHNLLSLCCLIEPKYQLRCCYTCQWSEYSPYDSDDVETMFCYRAHKEEYLKVNDKDDYFDYLEGLPCEQRHETYVCSEFAPCDQYEG